MNPFHHSHKRHEAQNQLEKATKPLALADSIAATKSSHHSHKNHKMLNPSEKSMKPLPLDASLYSSHETSSPQLQIMLATATKFLVIILTKKKRNSQTTLVFSQILPLFNNMGRLH
jgi:hypothetical protein